MVAACVYHQPRHQENVSCRNLWVWELRFWNKVCLTLISLNVNSLFRKWSFVTLVWEAVVTHNAPLVSIIPHTQSQLCLWDWTLTVWAFSNRHFQLTRCRKKPAVVFNDANYDSAVLLPSVIMWLITAASFRLHVCSHEEVKSFTQSWFLPPLWVSYLP